MPESLPPPFARTSLSLLADQTHVNLLGNVHGGEVMRLVDTTAGERSSSAPAGGPRWRAAMGGSRWRPPDRAEAPA